jgi:hypothetical protein
MLAGVKNSNQPISLLSDPHTLQNRNGKNDAKDLIESLISPEVCINNIATLFPHCHPAINLPFATQLANLGVLGVDLADAQSNPWQVSWVEVGEGLHRSSPPFHVRFWEVCVGSRGTLSVDDTARHSLVI